MSRIISALDVPITPVPDEVSTAVTDASATMFSVGGIFILAGALVAIAVFGIIFYVYKNNKKAEK